MGKRVTTTIAVIIVLSAGLGWMLHSHLVTSESLQWTGPVSQGEDSEPARYRREIEARLTAIAGEVGRLRAENEELKQALQEQAALTVHASRQDPVVREQDPLLEPQRIDWDGLKSSLAAWLNVEASLVQEGNRRLTASEREIREAFYASFRRTVQQAHAITAYPIFHEDVFPDLAVSLCGPLLGLDDSQAAQLEEAARHLVFTTAAELQPEHALPLERALAREDMITELLAATEAILKPEQQTAWQLAVNAVPGLLGGSQRRVEKDIEGWDDTQLVDFIAREWRYTYKVNEAQAPQLKEYALVYGRHVRELLQEQGKRTAENGSHIPDDNKALNRAMLDLQISMENQVRTLLDPEQETTLASAGPVILVFGYRMMESVTVRKAPSF